VNGVCPFCKEAVVLKQTAKEGDLIVCQACDTELEIVSLKPVELDWPLDDYDMDEDFDDYEDDLGRTRTSNPSVNSRLLCRLSYQGILPIRRAGL
jgi:lysine biosynthesis protein LysW